MSTNSNTYYVAWVPDYGQTYEDAKKVPGILSPPIHDFEDAATEFVERNFDELEYPTYIQVQVALVDDNLRTDVEPEIGCFGPEVIKTELYDVNVEPSPHAYAVKVK